MISDQDSLAYWVEEASFIDPAMPTELEPKGMTIVSAHWQSCFYFWDGHTSAKRQALAQCIEHYVQQFDEQLTWGFKTQTNGNWRATGRKHIKSFAQVMQDNPEHDDCIEYYLASGDPKWEDYASPFVISCMTSRSWKKRIGSNLFFRVPSQYVLDARYRIVVDHLIEECIELLEPFYAISGLQAATPYNQNSVAPEIYHQAQRYLGIIQGEVYDDNTEMKHGLKSLDWLTYISQDLAERYGSHERFYQCALERGIDIRALTQGYLITASELPQVLPITEPIPHQYWQINQLLRPLRNGYYGSLSIGGWEDEPPRFDLISSDAWVRRFDHPNTFPIGPLSPIESKATHHHRIQSGQVCQYDGRYRYNEDCDSDGKPLYHEYDDPNGYEVGFEVDDFRQFVVLNKGDIVPYYLDLGAHGELRQVKAVYWTLVSEIVERSN